MGQHAAARGHVGRSASGTVFIAKDRRTHKVLAIKRMDLLHQPKRELILNEIMIMRESRHGNIVNFLDRSEPSSDEGARVGAGAATVAARLTPSTALE